MSQSTSLSGPRRFAYAEPHRADRRDSGAHRREANGLGGVPNPEGRIVTQPDTSVGIALLQELLGCAWGHGRISTADDPDPCPRQAVEIVVLHDGPEREWTLKLCADHCERVLAETTPHAEVGS